MSAATLHTSANWPGLQGPVIPLLLQFNLLPSRTLHPEQIALHHPPQGLEQADGAVLDALHRLWSKRLLDRLGAAAAPILKLEEPSLPLAIVDPDLMGKLTRQLGIALLGPPLRRVIERREVIAVREALGQANLAWAFEGARALHPGIQDTHGWLQLGWRTAADLLGAGLLAQAWNDAPAPLRERADLKLPPDSLDADCRNAAGMSPLEARKLCFSCLTHLEPSWLSYFPATR